MNVLSLFDGMSCGQIALKELGANVENYFAAEIDKFAIEQTAHNFPNTVHLGSVTDVFAKDLPKIDLLIGGSPCQGFSFAGKQLNFDDPRSALFFEFVRLWNEIKEINPDAVFLLENVNMKKEHLRVISEYLGVFPININSNLVSAQNRNRWYWTNIRTKKVGLFDDLFTDIPQPEDKGILLKDILQDDSEIDRKYYISDRQLKRLDLGGLTRCGQISFNKPGIENKKATALLARDYKGIPGKQGFNVCVAMRGRENGNKIEQQLEPNNTGKTNCLTSVTKDNLVLINKPHGFNKGGILKDKTPTVLSNSWEHNNHILDGYKFRRLTPTECARLQTIPPWYKWIVSDTQIYKMLGNGWTVDIIKHIFSFIHPNTLNNETRKHNCTNNPIYMPIPIVTSR